MPKIFYIYIYIPFWDDERSTGSQVDHPRPADGLAALSATGQKSGRGVVEKSQLVMEDKWWMIVITNIPVITTKYCLLLMLTIIVDVFNMEIEDGVPMMRCLLDVAFVEVHLEFWGVGGVDNLASLVLFNDVCILLGNLVWRSYLINDFQAAATTRG